MSIYTKVELPFYWEDKENLNLTITFTPSFTSGYCYSQTFTTPVKVNQIYFYQSETNADFTVDWTTSVYGLNAKTNQWDLLCQKKISNVATGDWSNSGTFEIESSELYKQFRMTTRDSKRAIKYEIKLVSYSEKVEITEQYTLHEVSNTATTDCIFYKKVNVTRHNDWVYYDFPENIIPVAVRINGELTYFDWDGAGQAAASFDYESSGRKEVINKTFGIAQGKTQAFDYTIDNLNETYNETASKIGHKFNSRTNGNTCYIRVYKWLEKKTVNSTVKVKGGYLNTKNGPKQIKAVVVNTEGGPKVVFGSLT